MLGEQFHVAAPGCASDGMSIGKTAQTVQQIPRATGRSARPAAGHRFVEAITRTSELNSTAGADPVELSGLENPQQSGLPFPTASR